MRFEQPRHPDQRRVVTTRQQPGLGDERLQATSHHRVLTRVRAVQILTGVTPREARRQVFLKRHLQVQIVVGGPIDHAALAAGNRALDLPPSESPTGRQRRRRRHVGGSVYGDGSGRVHL